MELPHTEQIQSVEELNRKIHAIVHKETLGKAQWVGGMVEGYFLSDRQHAYFNLTDENWAIRCFLPTEVRSALGFTVANGIELEVYGDIRVYDRRASIELHVQKAHLVERSSVLNFIDAENHLRERGLLDKPTKPLPPQIKQIILVTSTRSKAIDDFKDAYNRNASPETIADIKVVDIPLEGETAPARIAETLQQVYEKYTAEDSVIVLTRGGGRPSKLAVFNDLLIAEQIKRSPIPIVVAIGHEADTTFADRVADMSAITPTDAGYKLALHYRKKPVPCALWMMSFVLSGYLLFMVGLGLA